MVEHIAHPCNRRSGYGVAVSQATGFGHGMTGDRMIVPRSPFAPHPADPATRHANFADGTGIMRVEPATAVDVRPAAFDLVFGHDVAGDGASTTAISAARPYGAAAQEPIMSARTAFPAAIPGAADMPPTRSLGRPFLPTFPPSVTYAPTAVRPLGAALGARRGLHDHQWGTCPPHGGGGAIRSDCWGVVPDRPVDTARPSRPMPTTGGCDRRRRGRGRIGRARGAAVAGDAAARGVAMRSREEGVGPVVRP